MKPFINLLFVGLSFETSLDPLVEISKIKSQLLAQHKTVWGDYSQFSNSTNITQSDEVAWQWGFWPLTSIT